MFYSNAFNGELSYGTSNRLLQLGGVFVSKSMEIKEKISIMSIPFQSFFFLNNAFKQCKTTLFHDFELIWLVYGFENSYNFI